MILSGETLQLILDLPVPLERLQEVMKAIAADQATFAQVPETASEAVARRKAYDRDRKRIKREEEAAKKAGAENPTEVPRKSVGSSAGKSAEVPRKSAPLARVRDITLPTEITGKKERKEPLSSGDDFELAYRAYPHVKGRSSKRKTRLEWAKIPISIRRVLPAAIRRYAVEGREPNADCGAAAMERWIRDERYLDWLPVTEVITPKSPEEQAEQEAKWKAYTDRLEAANG